MAAFEGLQLTMNRGHFSEEGVIYPALPNSQRFPGTILQSTPVTCRAVEFQFKLSAHLINNSYLSISQVFKLAFNCILFI